jgi:hypothetical protein
MLLAVEQWRGRAPNETLQIIPKETKGLQGFGESEKSPPFWIRNLCLASM